MQPTIRNNRDEIVRRNWFKHGNRDCNIVFILGIPLTEDECILEENNLSIDVLNKNSERLCATMNFLVPSEVSGDR
jgi:hypothetical protein